MLRATLKKNRTFGAIVILILLQMYYMFSPTLNVSEKTTSEALNRRNNPVCTDNQQPPRQPDDRNKTLSKVLNVTDAPAINDIAKDIHKYTSKSDIKMKEPEVFYGDCYAYSIAGMTKRTPEIMNMNGCEKRLPKAMIRGIKKCGTGILTKYLSLHPVVVIEGEVLAPPGPHFTADALDKWRLRMKWSSPRMLSMTGKPMGFTSGNIKNLLDQNAKVIIIIRDPVVRAISDYVHERGILLQKSSKALLPPFNEMVIKPETGEINGNVSIIANGRYIDKYQKMKNNFGPDRVLVLDGEAFIQDPLPIMKQTERFLGLSPFFKREHFQKSPETGFYCANVRERPHIACANPKIKGRPHPEINDAISKKLYDYYRPFSLELAKKAGIDFPWLFQ
ncbi:heparan sulfate glucosamine 3-O-sulfotransferase 1 [Strongylocentrotus purpuratus]|uniref:Sulfotransferase domain-containing protein n=1 Tax=Strongylocentrotus purpuratus TaxID=7668 RepID=A0A7M7GG97_STRPU|nr:heparan sulfate glucosamine 3-O-sulfotransferase 1 [Strongylocentrotus purpuratus]